jgi:ribosomal-protein-alanine N-acetyltransferase
MVGTCGFAAIDNENNVGELGYVLNPKLWGLGIAVEAGQAIIGFGFNELGLNRIEAKYIVGNTASRRVMEKLGMKYEGTMRSSMLIKGIYRDIGICSILKSEVR